MTNGRNGRDWLFALVLAIVSTIALGVAGTREGYTRDEGYYFDAAELYVNWYGDLLENPGQALTRADVDRWFNYNHEHPALMKTLYGISWRLLHRCHCPQYASRHPAGVARKHRTLGLLDDAEALRLPADLFGGILVAVCYLFGAQIRSRRAGFVAAVCALATPRYFFHAQLACFDAPMATTWLVAVYCYWRSLTNRKWALPTGVAIGLAVATKHNGFFLPFVLGLHWLYLAIGSRRWRFPSALWIPETIAAVPVIELLHWPWLWFDTRNRFSEYMAFHLHHVYYNFEYLGVNYNKPPSPKGEPFILTLLTAPVTMLALAALGFAVLAIAARRRRMDERERSWLPASKRIETAPGLLIAMNALFPPAIISITGAPIFGETKHWLAAIPFLALAAGVGADALTRIAIDRLRLSGTRAMAAIASLCALAVLPSLSETWRSHPYALTHYNLLAGGPAGGADLGMNRQFWGYSTRAILPWLNAHAPRNAPIYWHDTNQPILNMNVRERLMRDDLGNTGLEEPGVRASTIAMVIHEKHFNKYEYWIWDFFGTARPELVLTDEGVPIVTLYERPR